MADIRRGASSFREHSVGIFVNLFVIGSKKSRKAQNELKSSLFITKSNAISRFTDVKIVLTKIME